MFYSEASFGDLSELLIHVLWSANEILMRFLHIFSISETFLTERISQYVDSSFFNAGARDVKHLCSNPTQC